MACPITCQTKFYPQCHNSCYSSSFNQEIASPAPHMSSQRETAWLPLLPARGSSLSAAHVHKAAGFCGLYLCSIDSTSLPSSSSFLLTKREVKAIRGLSSKIRLTPSCVSPKKRLRVKHLGKQKSFCLYMGNISRLDLGRGVIAIAMIKTPRRALNQKNQILQKIQRKVSIED